ncbi:MAG: YdiU family protein [Mariprofundaceae bacterium]|nr:YdiU family protein [Mariprofundaceae bacterium]
MKHKNSLSSLHFDHRFTTSLPADSCLEPHSRQVFSSCFSWVKPMKMSDPTLLIHAQEVADLLGLSEQDCLSELFKNVLSGHDLLDDMRPYAMCYGGHQFGSWAGQLGDGRAMNLGEVVNAQAEHWSLQLKGAGPTPYSRGSDGLAVLRSSLREFLCSEAMFHLGVPTTRALSLCLTGDLVSRDMFYDGHAKDEQGAVVCRVAPSFLRFGNFQLFGARKDYDTLKKLLDYTIQAHFPHLLQDKANSVSVYAAWFSEVCDLTQHMIVHWMRVGFVHGVMNTDNMSILGLTIDYGPYGWLEAYDPDWTPNTTDAEYRRYAFDQQGDISCWNLIQLANAIAPLVDDVSALQARVDAYRADYHQVWATMMGQKLGFVHQHHQEDDDLVQALLSLLSCVETDMTIFYRCLANIELQQTAEQQLAVIEDAFYDVSLLTEADQQRWCAWFESYATRLEKEAVDDGQRRIQMNTVNPKYVLRNYLAQMAIDKLEVGDMSLLHDLLEVLRHPYEEQTGKAMFTQKRPDWARDRRGCSMLSCSS